MTIRRRLAFSFAFILALFAANLVVYFWSNAKRTVALDRLQSAVTRRMADQSIYQSVTELKRLISLVNAGLVLGGKPEPLQPADAESFHRRFEGLEAEINSLSNASTPEDRAQDGQVARGLGELVSRWKTFVAEYGRNQPAAITSLSGRGGADQLSDDLLQQMVVMGKEEERRIVLARVNIADMALFTNRITVLLFASSILASAVIAVLLSSWLDRRLRLLRSGTEAIGGGDLTQRIEIPVQDELGELARAFNDMTGNLLSARTELESRSAEVRAINEQLVESESNAQAASRAKSEFLAKMSHELRTPLNAIIGYSEMLAEEAEAVGQTDFVPDLERIRAAGKHLLALINDILDISKIEAGKMELYPENFAVEPAVREVVATIQPLIEKNRNTLEVRCERDLGAITADLTKVRQGLFNLLSNACKFTQDGTITLAADTEESSGGRWLVLSVADTGIGMSPTQVEGLFQEFVQASSDTSRKYGGTGLGLALTRRFCRLMGGDVTVQSEDGRGSTFTMRVLDQTGPAVPSAQLIPSPNAGQHEHAGRRSPTHIRALVIDDDADARALITTALMKIGVEVATSSSGSDGLRMARTLSPAVITLDVMMADMDGWSVLSALKADPTTAGIPVIMLTIVEDRTKGFALGAADYLTKPVDRERLISVLARYWSSDRPRTALVVDDDPAVRELLQRTLVKEGWRVVEAANGRLALAQLRSFVPDLVLLDLMMPEMDGFETISEMRLHPEWRAIPVVVVTAKSLTTAERTTLHGGVVRILHKGSFGCEALMAELTAFVSAHAAGLETAPDARPESEEPDPVLR